MACTAWAEDPSKLQPGGAWENEPSQDIKPVHDPEERARLQIELNHSVAQTKKLCSGFMPKFVQQDFDILSGIVLECHQVPATAVYNNFDQLERWIRIHSPPCKRARKHLRTVQALLGIENGS